jgi:ATP-binding cassette subfamily B protein
MKIMNKKEKTLFIRAIKLIYPYKLKYIFAFVSNVINIALGLIQPIIWGTLISKLFSKDSSVIGNLIMLTFALYLIQTLFSYLQQYWFGYLNESIINDLKYNVFKKIINLPLKMFEKLGRGTFMSRLHEDTSAIANIVTTQLVNVIINIARAIIIGIVVFSINPLLALITIIMCPSTFIIYILLGNKLKMNSRAVKEDSDAYFKELNESLSGIKEIKSLGIKDNRIDAFAKVSDTLRKRKIKSVVITHLASNMATFMNYLSQIVIYSAGAYLTFNGKLEIEYFIAFTAYSTQFSSSLLSIINMNTTLQQVFVSLERIFGLIDEFDYESEKFGSVRLNSISGNIEFDNVTFGYDDKTPVINNISFSLEANRQYLFVGQSGCGKSTIVNLLLRFYDVNSGKITIDGYNIKDIDEFTIRKHISVVQQDIFLFNGSIRDNILVANCNASQEDLENACLIADLQDFINSQPDGYDSIISESGSNLSGGQKQRISIARAIIKKSKILLFDEATSALDSESQDKLRESIYKLSNTHTIIVITHKLTDLISTDNIFVINNGEISGYGSHSELIKDNDTYKKLYMSEIERYQTNLS